MKKREKGADGKWTVEHSPKILAILLPWLMADSRLCKLSLQFIFVMLSWSATITLSFLKLAKKTTLSMRTSSILVTPEARWTVCWAGWLSWGLLRWTRSLAIQWCTIVHSLTVWVRSSAYMYKRDLTVWGGSKGVINFPWSFLCNAEFSPSWALPEYILALIHLACLRVFSVTPWVIVYRLYRVRWQGQSDWF